MKYEMVFFEVDTNETYEFSSTIASTLPSSSSSSLYPKTDTICL